MAEKRTYETGSIQDLGNGKFRLRVSGGRGIGGTYSRPSKIYTSTKKEPEKQLKDAERQLALFVEEMRGKTGTGKNVSWLIDEYRKNKVCDLRYGTQQVYEVSLKRIGIGIGHIKLTDLTPLDIDRFYRALRKPRKDKLYGFMDGATGCVVNSAHQILKGMLKWAYRKDFIDRPIIDKVDVPSYKPSVKRALSTEEIAKLKIVLDEQWPVWKTFGYFAMQSGMRRSEILGLRWEKVNLETGVVEIKEQIIDKKIKDGGQVLGELKSRAAKRTIQVDPLMLKAWKIEQSKIRLQNPSKFWDDGFIFTSVYNGKVGKTLSVTNASTHMTNLFHKAGIMDVTLHGLRHNCATWILLCGASEADTAAFLGHSSIKVTKKHYIHAQEGYASGIKDIISKTDLV